MMERMIKAFYVLMIAMVVFLGGLLISKGISETSAGIAFEYQEGSAL